VLEYARSAKDSSGVHQYVGRSESVQGRQRIVAPNVDRRHRRLRITCKGFLKTGSLTIDAQHGGAFGAEAAGGRLADSRSGPGHRNAASVKPCCHHCIM
jgi:hypothetical protein